MEPLTSTILLSQITIIQEKQCMAASLTFHKTIMLVVVAFNKSTSTNKKVPKTSIIKTVGMEAALLIRTMTSNLTLVVVADRRILHINNRKRMLLIAGSSKMTRAAVIINKCREEMIMDNKISSSSSCTTAVVATGEGITRVLAMVASITMAVISRTMLSMIIISKTTRLAMMVGNMMGNNSKTTPMMATRMMLVVAIITSRTIEEWEATEMTSIISHNNSILLKTIEGTKITIRLTIMVIAITTRMKTTKITEASSSHGNITNRQGSSKSRHLPSSTMHLQLPPLPQKSNAQSKTEFIQSSIPKCTK